MAKQLNNPKIIICDTGVMSRFLTNKPEYVTAIEEIIDNGNIPVVTALIKIELYEWIFDYKNQIKKSVFERILSQIDEWAMLSIDDAICEHGVNLGKRFYFGIGDIITASASVVKKIELLTINLKHFKKLKAILYFPTVPLPTN